MRKGDIVKEVETGREGLIVYRRSNQEIGVNFSHWHILKNEKSIDEAKKMTILLGSDDLMSKEEIEVIN